MKQVLITGSSTGIGRAAAQELVAYGYHVFGSVRREADAAELQAQLGQNFTPLLFDVTDEAAIKAAADRVADQLTGQSLCGLINNAGVGGGGPLMHQPVAEVRRMFEINVLGVIAVTQAFLPLLGARQPRSQSPGRIINVSSVGGKITPPFLGAYSGSKHALKAMSNALRRELAIYGIDVIVIEPGSVKTAIWDKAEQEGFAAKYADTIYGPIAVRFEQAFIAQGRAGVGPEVVAGVIRRALESPQPKSRYALPDDPIQGWLLPRLLPDRWLDRLIARRFGLHFQSESR
jgi:NAD(P)-dependent dehydrogenase (short-subunit alcohol dehydrogenase family)